MAVSQPESFGALLRRWRLAAGLTQEELAERAGLSARGISDLERGVHRAPQRETIRLLAQSLGIDDATAIAFERAARGGPDESDRAGPGAGASPSRVRPPSLVGRRVERETLESHLVGMTPPLLVFSGEPGMGKTRLLQEAAEQGRARGMSVLEAGCQRNSSQEPYAPIVQALAGHIARMSHRRVQESIHDCSWLVHLLPELTDVVRQPWPSLVADTGQARRLMFGAVARFLTNVGGPAGTLLLLDDLQWAGSDALDLLDAIVRGASRARVRIVAAYRVTEVQAGHPFFDLLADLSRDDLVIRCALDSLSDEEARRLLEGLTREEGRAGDDWIRRTLQRAGGVPFFLVSCAQSIRASNESDEVPWTLTQSVRQRIARCSSSTRRVLQLAALAGRTTPVRLLIAATPDSEETVVQGLDEACVARLLEVTPNGHRFVHDVIREVVADDIGPAHRLFLHHCLARAVEGWGDNAPASELAWHWQQAGEPARALPHLLRAGQMAERMLGYQEAEAHYRTCAELADGQGDSSRKATALEKLGGVLHTTGRFEEAVRILERAVEAYAQAQDLEGEARATALLGLSHRDRGTPEHGLGRVEPMVARLRGGEPSSSLASLYLALTHLLFHVGRYQEMLAAAEQAGEIARALGDDRLLGEAEMRRGTALKRLGDPAQALRVIETALPLVEAGGDLHTLFVTLNNAGTTAGQFGDLRQNRLYLEKALVVAERAGNPVSQSFAFGSLGAVHMMLGEWQEARHCLERGVALSRLTETGVAIPSVNLGQLQIWEGDWQEAARSLDEAYAVAQATGDRFGQGAAQGLRAELDILVGRPADAMERLEPFFAPHEGEPPGELYAILAWAYLTAGGDENIQRAGKVVEQAVQHSRDQPANRVHALWAQGMTNLCQGRLTDAQAALEQGLALARSLPYPYLEARILEQLGGVQDEERLPDQAQACRQEALGIYRRLGAWKDVDRLEDTLQVRA